MGYQTQNGMQSTCLLVKIHNTFINGLAQIRLKFDHYLLVKLKWLFYLHLSTYCPESAEHPLLYLCGIIYSRLTRSNTARRSSTCLVTVLPLRYKACNSVLSTNNPSIQKMKECLLTKLTQFYFLLFSLAASTQ